MLGHGTCLKISILPIGIGLAIGLRGTCINGLIDIRCGKAWHLAASVSNGILHKLCGVQQRKALGYLLSTKIRIKGNTHFAISSAFFGTDHYYTVGGSWTIDCCSRCIFQNSHRLDIFYINGSEVAGRKSIYNI